MENPIIDSLPITYREITQPTQVSLPDTIFESISAVQYSITIFDSVIDPFISNFEDPYLKDTGNVLTFRGNRFRNGDFGGRIKMALEGKQRVIAIVFLLALAVLITISA